MTGEAAALVTPASYDKWRRSRLGRITDALERELLLSLIGPVAGRQILDVGCGDGELALTLTRTGARVAAVDADPGMLQAARRRLQAAGSDADLARADAAMLPFDGARFDVVIAVTVLCFVGQADRAMSEMNRVLKPGGLLVIGELGRHSFWAAWRRLRAWLGHETWQAARFRSAAQLRTLAREAHLSIETVRAAVFYPPAGWMAAMLAPLDRRLSRHLITGGAFVAVAARKRSGQESGTGSHA